MNKTRIMLGLLNFLSVIGFGLAVHFQVKCCWLFFGVDQLMMFFYGLTLACLVGEE